MSQVPSAIPSTKELLDQLRRFGGTNPSDERNVLPFWYTATFTGIAATGGTGSAQIQTDPGVPFVTFLMFGEFFLNAADGSIPAGSPCYDEIDGFANVDTAVPVATTALIRAEIDVNGTKLQKTPVRVRSMFCTARRPFYMPVPLVLPGNVQVTITLTNNNSVAINADLQLCGVKVFARGS